MSNFKSKKIGFRLKDAYLYRDFIIIDEYQYLSGMKGTGWCVLFKSGAHLSSQKTKRDCVQWVNEYYQEMDYFTNSQEFNEMGETK